MDIDPTVIVGFGSAVVGAVVGAAAGFCGAVHIERQRLNQKRVGVVQATLGELRGNAGCSTQVLDGARGPRWIRMRFSSETWQAAKFDLAQFVGVDLYLKLLFVYETLPIVERLSEEPKREGHDDPVKDFVSEWVEGIRDAMTGLLQLPEAAAFRSQWQKRLGEENQPKFGDTAEMR